jgi:hypothetical protein
MHQFTFGFSVSANRGCFPNKMCYVFLSLVNGTCGMPAVDKNVFHYSHSHYWKAAIASKKHVEWPVQCIGAMISERANISSRQYWCPSVQRSKQVHGRRSPAYCSHFMKHLEGVGEHHETAGRWATGCEPPLLPLSALAYGRQTECPQRRLAALLPAFICLHAWPWSRARTTWDYSHVQAVTVICIGSCVGGSKEEERHMKQAWYKWPWQHNELAWL